MEDNNQRSQFGDASQSHLDISQNSTLKLVVSVLGISAALGLVGFSVYRSYFVQRNGVSENLPDIAAPLVREAPLKDGYALYRNTDTAISFQYPKGLFLLGKDEDGHTVAPQLSFRPPSYPEDFSRDVCITDCIQVSFTIGQEIVWPPDMSAIRGSDAGSSPKEVQIYQDETGSKPFQINGAEAIRYYEVRWGSLYDDYYQIQPNQAPAPGAQLKGYALRERIYIKDPHFDKRIIRLTYYEPNKNNLPIGRSSEGGIFFTEFLNGAKIRQLFNQAQHQAVQDVLASLVVLPIDWDAFAAHSSDEFNISFQAPKYWGSFIGLGDRGRQLAFRSPFREDVETSISFGAVPLTKRDCCGEGAPEFHRYSGESLNDTCQPDAYFNTDSYDVRVEKCQLRTLRSGIKALVIRGVSADKYDLWDEIYQDFQAVEIPPASRQYLRFKSAFLQLKSASKPGLIISFAEDAAHIADEVRNLDFDPVEKIFDKIIDSLAYIK